MSSRGAGKAPRRGAPLRKKRAGRTEEAGEKERPRVKRRKNGVHADKPGGKRQRETGQERARTRARAR